MGGKDCRSAEFGEACYQVSEALPGDWIHADRRLVHEDDSGLSDVRHSGTQPALLAHATGRITGYTTPMHRPIK